jgi:CheY-like chemotaxis protein
MAEYSFYRLHVLLIDDNAYMRKLLHTLLVGLGFNSIQEAEDGVEGLDLLKSYAADLAIVDWEMPQFDGIEFTQMVRHAPDSPNRFLPIIMLSGHAELKRVLQARDAGVNEYLTKPVSAQRLYRSIVSLIERPRKFITADNYFGPDRRFRDGADYKGAKRRESDEQGEKALTQDEIEAMFE